MKTRTKRRLAIGLGALATAVVCLVVPPFAIEQFYLVQLDSADEAIRQKAAGALAQARSVRAVPRLADMFRRIPLEYVSHSFTEVDVLHYSGLALVAIGPSSVPVFIDALRSENEHDRDAATRALGHLGSVAREAVPGLIRALGDESQGVRCQAARTLGYIGAAAREAIPQLAAATETDDCEFATYDCEFATYAAWAIQRIQGNSAAPDSPGWEGLQRKIEQLRMETLMRGELSQWTRTDDPL